MMKAYETCRMVMNSLKTGKKGQGMVEYGLIVGLIALAVIVAIVLLGGNITNLFNSVANTINNVTPTPIP